MPRTPDEVQYHRSLARALRQRRPPPRFRFRLQVLLIALLTAGPATLAVLALLPGLRTWAATFTRNLHGELACRVLPLPLLLLGVVVGVIIAGACHRLSERQAFCVFAIGAAIGLVSVIGVFGIDWSEYREIPLSQITSLHVYGLVMFWLAMVLPVSTLVGWGLATVGPKSGRA